MHFSSLNEFLSYFRTHNEIKLEVGQELQIDGLGPHKENLVPRQQKEEFSGGISPASVLSRMTQLLGKNISIRSEQPIESSLSDRFSMKGSAPIVLRAETEEMCVKTRDLFQLMIRTRTRSITFSRNQPLFFMGYDPNNYSNFTEYVRLNLLPGTSMSLEPFHTFEPTVTTKNGTEIRAMKVTSDEPIVLRVEDTFFYRNIDAFVQRLQFHELVVPAGVPIQIEGSFDADLYAPFLREPSKEAMRNLFQTLSRQNVTLETGVGEFSCRIDSNKERILITSDQAVTLKT